MANRVRQTTQEFAAAATATPTLLTHAADDVIFFVITQDGGGTAISTATSGWTVYDPGSASGGSRQALAVKRAASSSETAPVFAGSTDEWTLQQFIIKDVDTTTALDFTPVSSAWNAVASKASPAASSVTDDTLVFFSWGSDANQKMRHKIGEAVYLDNWRHSANACASLVAYRQMFASGSVPTVTMYAINANEGGHAWVIGFRNKSGGSLEPMPAVTATEARWYGDYGASHDATTTWGDLQDAGPTTINGIAVSSTAPTVTASSQTGFESTPNGSGTLLARNTNLATEEFVGGAHSVTSFDATGLILDVQWAITNITTATLGAEGVIVVLGDSAGGWVSYQLSKRQDTAALNPYWNQIAVGQATEYDSSGTFDITDLSFIGWGYHRLAGSTTNIGILFKNLTFVDNITLTGGGATSPCSPSVIANAMNAEWFFKQGELLGSGMTLGKCKVNIGDGSNKLYFDASRTAMELPPAYDQATNRFTNIDPSALGVTINAAASNTVNITACSMNANQSQPFTIASGSSTSASYDFTGGAISNHAPVLKSGINYVGPTFASCGEIDAKGATLTNATITDTTSTDAAIAFSATGGVMSGCTIDVTGTGAAYHIGVGDGGTGNFALTLTNHTFTGTPGTDKVHVTNTSGTTTITITGTTSLVAGDVTTAGATVVIAAPEPTLDATVLANSRVLLHNDTTDVELDNTAPGGTSWSKTITSGASIGDTLTLYVFKEGYEEFSTSFLYSGEDTTLLVTQAVHPHIASLRTELGISDYTTITEFTLDITGTVEIDADDADGNTQKARLAIWYNGILTTENGARYLRGAISVLSTAAIRINVATLDLQLTNVSVTYGLNFTDTERRLYRSDGTPIYSATSAAGSIQNDYSGVPDTVETGVSGLTGPESAQLMGLPSASDILTAAAASPIAANVKKVNDLTVDGAGTEADPWGPV